MAGVGVAHKLLKKKRKKKGKRYQYKALTNPPQLKHLQAVLRDWHTKACPWSLPAQP